jgi:DNA-binding response OmpR family regulator
LFYHPSSEAMDFSNKTVRSILLIDDDVEDYDLVNEAIQEINPSITVHYISTCKEALLLKDKEFDIILLDINMPVHDGFKWLKGIRENGYTNLPVIMYTNSRSPANISKAYEEGANLYFSKPESFGNLLKSLKKLISMDWSHPFSITEKYFQPGKYKVFEL